ncbi:MAG: large-conductance mechanosensitive channel protein MscL [Verrucomicrobiota bacterium]
MIGSVLEEFRKFILKGDVVSMAVGIIIGGAFGTVVKSLVNNVVMPPIGLLLGGVDFSKLSIVMKPAEGEAEAVELAYGTFINDIITLVIVGFAVFLLVKGVNKVQDLSKKEEEEASSPPEPSNEEKLLTEIRDLLASK